MTLPRLLQTELNDILHVSDVTLDSQEKVWACSPFVAHVCLQYPELYQELIDSGELLQSSIDYPEKLSLLLQDIKEESEVMRILRISRRREMVRIAWRDLASWAPLEETLKSLSDLADAMINAALTWLHQRLITIMGTPCDTQGVPQSLFVLALGKLGGQELNFSSDIDLIFGYPESGETVGVKRSRTNQEFFTRLGQQLVVMLNQNTADGFVFRVDMRLRPFGDSGALVMSISGMETYYETHARDWERYAFVKARSAAGDIAAGETLLKILRPFVYRRYLDFNAFEALRTMKTMIDQETKRKGLNNNLKLGIGGIREIEFTCQVFQLIRGGRQPALQQRHLLRTLEQLKQYHILPPSAVTRLHHAYCFLRLSENHLQAIDDQQTQTLPDDALNQTRLAYSMGFEHWTQFLAQLKYHQHAAHQEFERVIAPHAPAKAIPSLETIDSDIWKTYWYSGFKDDSLLPLLQEAGFQNPLQVFKQLQQLSESRIIKKLTRRGHEKFDILIPSLITTALEQHNPDNALHRSLNFIETVAQRTVYLSLLIERPLVLKQLVRLCADSAWIAEQITRYPLLLDELLDPRSLYNPLKQQELDNALQAQLAHLPPDDLEMQMDSLRQFKRAYVLHVAASEISGNLTAPVTSDYLTGIADTLVRRSLSIAYDYLTQKHGHPYCHDQGEERQAEFCIVAYGKAGGIELSYGSDLDIVFLHDSSGSEQMTHGEKSLNNQTFFVRLGQRIIHIITANTPAGILYEVDSRLRPGGATGLLVSSFEAFHAYQLDKAWTWEHQALVRARAIAGNPKNMAQFEQMRRDILSIRRNPDTLKKEICDMRDKMRHTLDKSTDKVFDLKHGRGGIIDIEFMIQYMVLRWAADYPGLLDTTGMLPQLQLCVTYNLLTATACQQLSDAFRAYRCETHRLALQNKPALVNPEKFSVLREQVRSVIN